MSLRYRTALVAALTGSAVVVPAVGAAAVSTAPSGPRCDVGAAPHQPAGTYSKVFRQGPAVPHLDRWTPQGLTTWHNWDGKGHNLLLMGMYREGHRSYLVGINPKSGKTVGTVRTPASHFGSLGVVGRWVIGQDSAHGSNPTIRRYPTSSLAAAMLNSQQHGHKPFLGPTGKPQKVHSVGFMTVTGNAVWLGKYTRANPTSMYRYRVDRDGLLRQTAGPWKVPPRTQGVLVTKDRFVFASSEGGTVGKLTVVDRARPNTPVACVTTPSLPENMTVDGGKVYAAYESGAGQFAGQATGRVRDLRTGLLRSMLSWGAGTGGLGGQAAAHGRALNPTP